MRTLLTLLPMLIMAPAVASSPSQVAWVATEHWPPWEIARDERRQNVTEGIALEILKAVFDELDIKLRYKDMSWQRALLEVDDGAIDIIPIMSINGERTRNVLFTRPFHTEPIVFAYNSKRLKDFSWRTLGDLKPYRIAAIEGRNYAPDWADLLDNELFEIQKIKQDTTGIKMLLNGRVDLMPVIHSNGIHLVQENPYSSSIRFADKALMYTSFHFGISQHSFLANRLPEINKALAKVLRRPYIKERLEAIYHSDFASALP